MKTVLLVSLIIVILRIAGLTADVFKDIAHIWVGLLIGAWSQVPSWRLFSLWASLCVIETVCAVVTHWTEILRFIGAT